MLNLMDGPDARNATFRSFKDRHLGRRIWVCGAGPSLLEVDESKLTSHDVVIACNSAIRHFRNADYFIWVDGTVRQFAWFSEVLASTQQCISLDSVYGDRPVPINCVKVFDQSHDWGNWVVDDTGHFPGNVTQRAVSFAYIMGASQIVLAGCDCTGGHPYEDESDLPGGMVSMPHQDLKPYVFNDQKPFVGDLFLWRKMREANPNLPIVNICRNTPLREFPFVETGDLINA